MKLVCSQIDLNSALQLVTRAVSARPTHPVLANVLLTADAATNRLSLTGFDLNLGIQTSISSSVETSGAITLPARLFGEIVSRLSSNSSISLNGDETSENLELKSLNGTYQMRGISADDFPDLPLVKTGKALLVKPSSLANAIRGTLFASSSDEAKQLLTGVHLRFNENGMEAAATDGHRLAVNNTDSSVYHDDNQITEEDNNFSNFEVNLPSKSLRELERFISSWGKDETVSLFYEQGQVVFVSSDQVVTTRTLEGVYPNYKQLIPDEFSRFIELDRRDLISALERIAVLADQHNNVVKLNTELESKKVKISTDAQDVGSGNESIDANIKGDEIQIAFNVKYVLDGLKVIDSDRVLIRCNAPTTPVIFSSDQDMEGFIYLVMPVQVRT